MTIAIVSARAIIAAGLRNMEAEYRAAVRAAEEARLARNAAVLDAMSAGWTHAEIAGATGLTRGRIGQIASERTKP